MPSERYFVKSIESEVVMEGQEFHHLSRVMRARIGDQIELINGEGVLAKATVKELLKKQVLLEVTEIKREEPNQKTVFLAQAIPKPNRLDYILEKGTELGVDEFWLFPGEKSVKEHFSENQFERMNGILIAAIKQTRRLFLPKLKVISPLIEWKDFSGSWFFGDVEERAPLFVTEWNKHQIKFPIVFCVGPESGFSTREVDYLKRNGVKGVCLHQNILRTDTAPLVALSLIEHWLMDMECGDLSL